MSEHDDEIEIEKIDKDSGGRPRAFSKQDLEKVGNILESCNGNITRTAEFLQVARTTLLGFIKENPSLKERIHTAKESRYDRLEEVAFDLAEGRKYVPAKPATKDTPMQPAIPEVKPDKDMLKFVLERKASHRGWSQRINLSANSTGKELVEQMAKLPPEELARAMEEYKEEKQLVDARELTDG